MTENTAFNLFSFFNMRGLCRRKPVRSNIVRNRQFRISPVEILQSDLCMRLFLYSAYIYINVHP